MRGRLTMAASCGRSSSTLITSIEYSAVSGFTPGSPSLQIASSSVLRTPDVPEL